MDNIVRIELSVIDPSAFEEEGYQFYKSGMAGDCPLIKDPSQVREYHLCVASWEFSTRDPAANGWRRSAREWLKANLLSHTR